MPKLIYLVGIPGSGKSYYAKTILKGFPSCVYLSSDELRKELYGDENCQDNPGYIFDQMLKRTIVALKNGQDVIYDATNVVRKKRINFLKSIPSNIECTKECYIAWARLDTCIQRDARRDRTVGENVILKMVKKFQTPWYDEGWDKIRIILPDIDPNNRYRVEEFNLDIPHDNPHHPNTIRHHIANVCREVLKLNVEEKDKKLLYYVAIMHDIGKPLTKSFINNKGEVTEVAHYYQHQNVSAYLALGMLLLMWVSPERVLLVSYLVNMHMEPFFNESKYFKNMDPELKKLVLTFNECDKRGA